MIFFLYNLIVSNLIAINFIAINLIAINLTIVNLASVLTINLDFIISGFRWLSNLSPQY